MSLTFGFATEGPTDRAVLEVLVAAVFGTFQTAVLQPRRDRLAQDPGGEGPLRQWCDQKRRVGLVDEMEIGAIDVVIVQIDADMCAKYGCADTTALCTLVRGTWLGLVDPLPPRVVVVIPRHATEAWLLAAMLPDVDGAAIEDCPRPADALALGGHLPVKPDKAGRYVVRKPSPEYGKLARSLLTSTALAGLRSRLVELDRFLGKLEALRASSSSDSQSESGT